jgi:DNA-directed RNA polymerase specialized sigma24 family protein
MIDDALTRWARWALVKADGGLGYSRTTTLGRVIDLGPQGAAIRCTNGHRAISAPLEERIESAVVGLPEQLKLVVMCEYLRPGSRGQHARDCGLSRYRYERKLHEARTLLAAVIG